MFYFFHQRHQALPIQKGQRHQMVVWLFGSHGYVRFVPYEDNEQRSVEERWSLPKTTTTTTTTIVEADENSDDEILWPEL
jgi:hypothetical protein